VEGVRCRNGMNYRVCRMVGLISGMMEICMNGMIAMWLLEHAILDQFWELHKSRSLDKSAEE
jgi:hypothetical protein